MKKLIALAILTLMLAACAFAALPASAAENFDGWTPISSGADFAKIASGASETTPNKYYLTTDITVNATVGSGWNPAPISNVIIDGNGKSITLSKSLFIRVNNFTMQNVTLKGKIVWNSEPFMKSPITSGNGDTVGKITLTNVTSEVDMEVCFSHRYKRLAGVIYYTGSGSVLTNVKYTGNITVKNSSSIESKIEVVGGVVANAIDTRFENCVNEGSILIENGVTPGLDNNGGAINGYVGGIVGKSADCTFVDCTNAADIDIQAEAGRYIASGILSAASGSALLNNCKNSGDLAVSNCTDGLVPCIAYNASMANCENTGNITVAYKKVEGSEGSCNEKGVMEHYLCSACGTCFDEDGNILNSEDLVLGNAHSLGELIPTKNATCAENGMSAHYICSECNNYFDENKQKTTEFALTRVAGHNFGELIALVEPTTEATGMKAHYECADCKKLFDENKADADAESLTIAMLDASATDATDTTDATEAKTEATDAPTETETSEQSGGCSSSFGGAAIAVVSLLGVAIFTKKKENGGN